MLCSFITYSVIFLVLNWLHVFYSCTCVSAAIFRRRALLRTLFLIAKATVLHLCKYGRPRLLDNLSKEVVKI